MVLRTRAAHEIGVVHDDQPELTGLRREPRGDLLGV